MSVLKLGKDYNLQFAEPYDTEEERLRLTGFVERMFASVSPLSERVRQANQLHDNKPVSIIFSQKMYYAGGGVAEIDFKTNRLWININKVNDYGVYDKRKSCVVQMTAALMVGHELTHLSDPKVAIDPNEFYNTRPLMKAIAKYLTHEDYMGRSPETQAYLRSERGEDIAHLSSDIMDVLERAGFHTLTTQALQQKQAELLAMENQKEIEYRYKIENHAAQSELEISQLYPEGSLPVRRDYLNSYLRKNGYWFWEDDVAVQGMDSDFEQFPNDYPPTANWCDNADQLGIYELPSSKSLPKP